MPPAICIRCLTPGTVVLALDDEAGFRCELCKKSFSADDVRKVHAAWDERLKWIDAHPQGKKE